MQKSKTSGNSIDRSKDVSEFTLAETKVIDRINDVSKNEEEDDCLKGDINLDGDNCLLCSSVGGKLTLFLGLFQLMGLLQFVVGGVILSTLKTLWKIGSDPNMDYRWAPPGYRKTSQSVLDAIGTRYHPTRPQT